MHSCKCGKQFKTEKWFSKHHEQCEFVDLDESIVYQIGEIIYRLNDSYFIDSLIKGSVLKRFVKINNVTLEEAELSIKKESIFKHRKSLWSFHKIWEQTLLVDEYETFLKWVFTLYFRDSDFQEDSRMSEFDAVMMSGSFPRDHLIKKLKDEETLKQFKLSNGK